MANNVGIGEWFWVRTRPGRVNKASADWPRILRDLNLLTKKGYERSNIKYAVESMLANSKVPKFPIEVTWKVPRGGGISWYDMATPEPPPLWDSANYDLWERGLITPVIRP